MSGTYPLPTNPQATVSGTVTIQLASPEQPAANPPLATNVKTGRRVLVEARTTNGDPINLCRDGGDFYLRNAGSIWKLHSLPPFSYRGRKGHVPLSPVTLVKIDTAWGFSELAEQLENQVPRTLNRWPSLISSAESSGSRDSYRTATLTDVWVLWDTPGASDKYTAIPREDERYCSEILTAMKMRDMIIAIFTLEL